MEQHGQLAKYIHGCRCEECRGANREAQRRHRERRKAGTTGRQPKKEKKPTKPRKHKGNPAEGDGWESIWYGDGVEWTLAIKAGGEWQQVKLAANGTVEHKANYWLAWNGERLARSIGLKLLEQNRPDLAARVLRTLVGWTDFQNAMARGG